MVINIEPLIIRIEYITDNLVSITPEEIIFQTGPFSSSYLENIKIDNTKENDIKLFS